MYHEYGEFGMGSDVLRHAAEQGLAQPAMAVSAHHEQIGAAIGRCTKQKRGHRPLVSPDDSLACGYAMQAELDHQLV